MTVVILKPNTNSAQKPIDLRTWRIIKESRNSEIVQYVSSCLDSLRRCDWTDQKKEILTGSQSIVERGRALELDGAEICVKVAWWVFSSLPYSFHPLHLTLEGFRDSCRWNYISTALLTTSNRRSSLGVPLPPLRKVLRRVPNILWVSTQLNEYWGDTTKGMSTKWLVYDQRRHNGPITLSSDRVDSLLASTGWQKRSSRRSHQFTSLTQVYTLGTHLSHNDSPMPGSAVVCLKNCLGKRNWWGDILTVFGKHTAKQCTRQIFALVQEGKRWYLMLALSVFAPYRILWSLFWYCSLLCNTTIIKYTHQVRDEI